jgi:hypothetical protein
LFPHTRCDSDDRLFLPTKNQCKLNYWVESACFQLLQSREMLRSLIPLLLSFLVAAGASASPCYCPPKDPMAQPKCGPAPAKLDETLYQAKLCLPFMAPEPFGYSSNIFKPMAELLPGKNPQDVLDYMSCYRGSDRSSYRCSAKDAKACGADQRFCHFRQTMAPLIQLSAQSGKLPFSVQACHYKRESDYIPTAGSNKGALGYIQFMPKTEAIVNEVIHGSYDQWNKQIAAAEKIITERKKVLAKTKDKRERAKIQAVINNAKADLNFAKGPMEARKAWDRFWEGTKNPPKSVTRNSATCPNLAIAMGMVKQLYDLYQIKKISIHEANDSMTIAKMDEVDSNIFLDGAYNVGVGTFGTRCGASKTLQQCMNRFGPEHETRRHMESLRNCAYKNSTEPMVGDSKRNCEASKCVI